MTLCLCFPQAMNAQSFLNPVSAGMGGTSVTHGTGPSAAFFNPSNLMFMSGDERWQITLPQASLYTSSGFTRNMLTEPYHALIPYTSTFSNTSYISESNRNRLIDHWFGDEISTFQDRRLDLHIIGVQFNMDDLALALNYRIRSRSWAVIGRGWFDDEFITVDGFSIMNRNLYHKLEGWHEIALGFGWEQELISGWTGNMSSVVVGLNPKLILPYTYQEHDYRSLFGFNQESELVTGVREYKAMTTSSQSNAIRSYFQGDSFDSISPWSESMFGDFSGIGVGFDAGITYELLFGDKVRIGKNKRLSSVYNLRVSLALHDIGLIAYSKDVIEWQTPESSATSRSIPSLPNREFHMNSSSAMDFIRFETHMLAEEENRSSIRQLMASKYTAGVGLQLNRILLTAEFQQRILDDLDESGQQSVHLGNEIRILPSLAIRSGLIVGSLNGVAYTAGIGYDTRHFSLSAAAMAQSTNETESFRPVLLNVGSLQLRF